MPYPLFVTFPDLRVPDPPSPSVTPPALRDAADVKVALMVWDDETPLKVYVDDTPIDEPSTFTFVIVYPEFAVIV
ncbi:hypothetical protein SDC9_115926 [bioreactor metagenome]|uniref:Uncharacterized protein n=1 Tax=bioreactor metagenome TaxID=1076179 RepID=A0A645BU82_9ZZZZ